MSMKYSFVSELICVIPIFSMFRLASFKKLNRVSDLSIETGDKVTSGFQSLLIFTAPIPYLFGVVVGLYIRSGDSSCGV